MHVLGFDPQITVQRAWQLSSGVEQALSLDDLFVRSDMITVHVPLARGTRSLVNAARLKLMRNERRHPELRARGIVDEAAVVDALEQRQAAGLRLRLPDCAAEGSPEDRDAAAPRRFDRRGRRELRRDGRRHAARLPRERQHQQLASTSPKWSCRAPRSATRLSIANENVPNMVGQISTALAAAQPQHRRPAQQVARRICVHAHRYRRRRARSGDRQDPRRSKACWPCGAIAA